MGVEGIKPYLKVVGIDIDIRAHNRAGARIIGIGDPMLGQPDGGGLQRLCPPFDAFHIKAQRLVLFIVRDPGGELGRSKGAHRPELPAASNWRFGRG